MFFEKVLNYLFNSSKKYLGACLFYLLPSKKLSWSGLGLTLDEYQDYILIKKIIEYFNKKNKLFTCDDVIKIVKKKNWMKINHKVERKENNLKI